MKIREATQIIGMLERGDFAAALTEELHAVVKACQDDAGPKRTSKGSLTLKIDVAVQGVQITFAGSISAKTPKIERGSSVFFLTQEGAISTEHPTQADMFQAGEGKVRPIKE